MATVTVTVLFTDLVGSTALMSRVGETAADALRREHFDLLRLHVTAAGGVEVKNLGDGLMVVFTSAADAVAASVGMQQELWRRNRRAEEALEIRVGVAAGDVEVDEGDYFGAPVVQAARLCSAAGTGEILCTDLVKMLAGSRTVAEFEPVGALELKGLDEPVPASRVAWPRPEDIGTDGAEVVLPGRLEMAVADDFVGREAEYERLTAAWKAAAEGDRRVVLLAGEPGIGKTTLSARLAGDVHGAGGVVTYGRCDEDLGISYQPWIEALTHLVTCLPQDVLDAHVADRGGHLARLVPELTHRTAVSVPDRAQGDGERFVLFGCVVDLLKRASIDRPVLVVLDDLHWADRQSVQLLRHVVGCGQPLRVMFLGTFRDSDVAAGDPVSDLLAALHREQGTERISLRGLTDVDVLGLLEQLAGHDMDDRGVALRDAVLAETAGNPFFVREILRHLAESGVIYLDEDGRWVGDVDVREVGLPVSVTEAVGRRLSTLGDQSVRVLSIAAVIGRDFDVALVAAAAGVDEDAVIDTCDAATAAAVLTPAGELDRYSFAHALIERTLYEGLSRSRRARTHRAVAEALEQLAGDDPGSRAGELAHHWSQAVQPEDNERAVRYAHLAADRALAQLAPDDAARRYTQALELLGATPDVSLRARLLVGLGDAQRQVGEPAFRATLAEAADLADQIDDSDLLVRAALASCRNFPSTGAVDEDLVALLQRAADRLGEVDTPQRARLLAALAVERYFGDDLDAVHDVAVEAVDVARRCGDPNTLAFVLQRSCIADRDPAHVALRLARLDEALELNAELGDPMLQFDLADQRRLLALECGDLEGIHRYGGLTEVAAERAPHATALWMLAFHRVWLEALDGDLAASERQSEAALELGLESGQPDAMTIYGASLANIRYHGGRLDELLELMEETARTHSGQAVYHAVIAQTHAVSGRYDEARAELDQAAASGFAARRDVTFTTTVGAWAEAAVRTRHPSMATIHNLLLPLQDLLVTTHATVQPAVAHFLAQLDHGLGRFDDAERWFAEADTIHRRMESPLLVAYSDVGLAALLAGRGRPGDAERARDLAEQVLSVATPGGYGYIERDAREVLERLGA